MARVSSTSGVSGEDLARTQQAEDNAVLTDEPDPTGATDEQLAVKQAATSLGDQDAVNLGYQYPPGSDVPSAQNVRRYPELFDQAVIDSFDVPDPDDAVDEDELAEDPDALVEAPGVAETPIGEVSEEAVVSSDGGDGSATVNEGFTGESNTGSGGNVNY